MLAIKMQGTKRSGDGGQGEKSLLCGPGSELRLGGREKKKGEDNKRDGKKSSRRAWWIVYYSAQQQWYSSGMPDGNKSQYALYMPAV